MINPHGSKTLNPLYVADDAKRAELQKEAEGLPKLLVCSQAAANAVMMGSGYFNPLTGFMSLADALLRVRKDEDHQAACSSPPPSSTSFPTCPASAMPSRIALLDPNVEGNPVIAIQDVTSIDEATDEQMATMTKQAYGTDDPAHPGVAAFNSVGKFFIAGTDPGFQLLLLRHRFPRHLQDRHGDPRDIIEKNGWNKIAAFQTRNPMHRAHEALVKIAMDRVGCRRRRDPHAAGQAEEGRHPGGRARRQPSARWSSSTSSQHGGDHRLRLRHALRRPARGGATRHLPPEHGLPRT